MAATRHPRMARGLAVFALVVGSLPALAQREDPRWDHEIFMRVPSAGELIVPPAAAPGSPEQAIWKYRFTAPSAGWTDRWYSDASWSYGQAGFEDGGFADPLDAHGTTWPGDKPQLWLRRTIQLTAADLERNALALWGRWDDTIEVFINGAPAFAQDYWTSMYRWAPITQEAQGALVVGTNVVAVHMTDYGGGRYFDLGVIRNPLQHLEGTGSNRARSAWIFEEAAREYFEDNLIPAGAIAVIKDERIVSSWSFGYLDKNLTTPLPPGAVFRLASLDKSPSFAALRKLIRDGFVEPVTGTTLTLDTPVFPLLGALGYTPPPGVTPDPRIGQITPRMLVEHTSGIGYAGSPAEMAAAFGITENELTPVHTLRWLHGAPMIADPGQGHYSNEGAAVARFLVNEFGGGIEHFLRSRLNAGLDAPDFYIAGEKLENRRSNEPWYQTHEPPFARWAYFECGFTLEASADSYVNYLRGYHLWTGEPLLNPVTGAYEPPDNGATVFFGAYQGTRTEAIQRRWDRVSYIILVNCNQDVGALGDTFWNLVESMAPDEWFCAADINQDGYVDGIDYDQFNNGFESRDPGSDYNGDGYVDGIDYDQFNNDFENGC